MRRTLPLCLSLLLLSACGERHGEVAAQVNRETISAQQLELLLKRQPGLKPEQADALGRQLLERLIDQELAVQAAEQLQLDREPAVQLQLDAARREVLARIYAERLAAELSPPSAQEIERFYGEQPQFFAERRIYRLQELLIEAEPAQRAALREQLGRAKNLGEFIEQLRAENRRVGINQSLRTPEQLPPATLSAVLNLQDGQYTVTETPAALLVLLRAGSQPATLELEQARPLIEQMLLARRRAERLQSELRRLRETARIEYRGRFAAPPPVGAAASAPAGSASSVL